MTMDSENNPIPTAVKDLLALFDGPLASVQFPDVDGVSLREHVASVDAGVRDVEAAAQAWAAAKRIVDERLEMLLTKAQRALAYARVYAEDKPELDAQLAQIVVPRWGDPRGARAVNGAEVAPARKRGRPKKTDVAAARTEPLILAAPPAPEAAIDVTLDAPEIDVSEEAAAG